MTVSEYIFDFLEKKGVKNVFMVSGSSAMWLTDALKRNDRLNAYCCHHEQAAAMSADCCGRVGDVPGVCLVTIGPGATNAITGVAEAYLDSSPMFVISGQANSKILQYQMDTGIRQKGTQSLDLEPMVSSITKYFAAVMSPDSIRFHMEKAYYSAMEGRRGPVWLDVPIDVQNRQAPEQMKGFDIPEDKKTDAEISSEALERLAKSEKPLVLAGFGVRASGSAGKLLEFCDKQNIPVVTSRGGIDVITTDNPLFVGRPGSYGDRASHFAIQECDFMLILGSRLSVSTIGYYPDRFGKNAYKVMADIDRKEIDKRDVPVDENYNCDLSDFIDNLSDRADSSYNADARKRWVDHCKELRGKYPVVLQEYRDSNIINSYYFTEKLSEHTPEGVNVVVDTGSVCNIVSQTWKLKENQRYIISGGLSCMGFWAGAIGLSTVSDKVIALSGDGSTQMNIQDFATMKYYKLPLKLFVYNNNGYMLIRHNQHNYMNDRFLGVGPDSGLQTPDFCRVAEAYGLKAVKIRSNDEIDEKLNEVFGYDGPVVCEVMVEEFGTIAPRITSRVMPDGSLKAAEFDDLWPFLEK